MLRTVYLLALILGLAACSTIYRSPRVLEGASDGTNVRVLKMTAESVVQANRSPYTPKTLPAIFSMTVGSGSGLHGAGALPTPPIPSQPRPGALVTRLPPAANPGPYMIGVAESGWKHCLTSKL